MAITILTIRRKPQKFRIHSIIGNEADAKRFFGNGSSGTKKAAAVRRNPPLRQPFKNALRGLVTKLAAMEPAPSVTIRPVAPDYKQGRLGN
jgi:hypothetical protein